jgi:hypothetical protein
MDLCCKPIIMVILAVSGALGAAAPFALSKDSVIETELFKNPDTVVMTNTQSDTLRIDSVTMLFDTAQMRTCEVGFQVLPSASIRSGVFYYWNLYTSHDSPPVLKPNESVKLLNFEIDLCIQCPVTSAAANVQSRVGDTIRAALVFHEGNFKDTLKIIGKRTVGSMAVRSNPSAGTAVRGNVRESSYNLMGQKLGPAAGACRSADKSAAKVVKPKATGMPGNK